MRLKQYLKMKVMCCRAAVAIVSTLTFRGHPHQYQVLSFRQTLRSMVCHLCRLFHQHPIDHCVGYSVRTLLPTGKVTHPETLNRISVYGMSVTRASPVSTGKGGTIQLLWEMWLAMTRVVPMTQRWVNDLHRVLASLQTCRRSQSLITPARRTQTRRGYRAFLAPKLR